MVLTQAPMDNTQLPNELLPGLDHSIHEIWGSSPGDQPFPYDLSSRYEVTERSKIEPGRNGDLPLGSITST